MLDRYTKTVLGVIAFSLLALAIEQATPAAHAQTGFTCGTVEQAPCYIEVTNTLPVPVRAAR